MDIHSEVNISYCNLLADQKNCISLNPKLQYFSWTELRQSQGILWVQRIITQLIIKSTYAIKWHLYSINNKHNWRTIPMFCRILLLLKHLHYIVLICLWESKSLHLCVCWLQTLCHLRTRGPWLSLVSGFKNYLISLPDLGKQLKLIDTMHD